MPISVHVKYRLSVLVTVCLLLFSHAPQIGATDMLLQAELWAELEPFLSEREREPWSAEGGVLRLLDTARFVFSAMTYGVSVRVVPAEPARGVVERSEVELRSVIAAGHPGLRTREVRESEGRVYGVFLFTPDNEQRVSREQFLVSSVARSSATGRAHYFSGPEGMQDAIRDAIVRAVLVQARRETPNRPAEIVADVLLSQPPVLAIRREQYTATVRVTVQIREIRQYELF